MKARELLKKYPDYWAHVETGVWEDLQLIDKDVVIMKPELMKRISYNAAFIATCEYHKENTAVG